MRASESDFPRHKANVTMLPTKLVVVLPTFDWRDGRVLEAIAIAGVGPAMIADLVELWQKKLGSPG
ncbi:hypothetical protein N185_08650 [Sinorhizobium sp. GW3]|nr:hypothetical protein N185_08650 [Sinorhizobium sp. GW3]